MNLYQLMKKGLTEEEGKLPKEDEVEYDENEIIDAFKSDKPEVDLKNIFGPTFWPKVKRWLEVELKDVDVDAEDENIVGGDLRARLSAYLEKDNSEDEYEENVKTLARGFMNAYKEWSNEQVKPQDLPHDDIEEG